MALTLSQSKYSRFNNLNYNQLFQNPYQYTPGKLSEETRSNFISAYENTRTPKVGAPVNEKRSILDRTLDGLQVFNYTLAGGINNLIDDDPETGFWRGVGDGLRASNPFGKGYEPGEVTFSKVLDTAGWQPESGLGKFARGTVGFGLDVVLDPTTYLGGIGLLVKGTGKVGATAKAIDGLAKQYNVPTNMLNASGKLDKMTPEVAEYILKNSERAEGLSKLSKADYDGTIDAFTRNYNRALGLRETGEVTIGLRNVPFGDAIVDKFIGKDKLGGVRLAKSNKGLATIGKYSGASHIYGATRNFLMGRQMIQKLSTTARYNALAKTNPIQLFDAVTFLRSTKGQQKSIRKATQDAIRKSSAMAKLSPAEQDAVIKLIEDPDNWNLVNKIIDEAEVKTYSELQVSMGKDLEELISRRQTLEDTYESVVSDLTMKMNTQREEIARQLRERGEISATLREKQYEIDWINAERERKLAELTSNKVKGFENLDKIRDERIAINAEYESEMTRLVNEQMDINNTLEDTINELARERAMESSRGGFEIIQANKELIDHELEVLGRQFAEKQSQIEKAIKSKEISFEQAQMARMELSAQLEAEAKRIYNRKYYQIKKIKPTTYDIAEQEKALAEAMKTLEELKAKGVDNYSAKEAKQLNATIAELKNERSRLLSEKAELTQHERVEKQLQEAINSEKALSSYIDKSFSVDTQFDGMEFSQIKDTISDQYKLVVTEALMNKIEKSASEAELFKLYKAGLDTENPYDVIAESIEFEEMNTLRRMLSELIVGSKSYLHLHGSDALKVSEFIMLDVNDKDSLVEFFINSGNLFLNTAKKELKHSSVSWRDSNKGQLDNVSAEYLANIAQTVGQLPMLRELLSENYGRLSGLDGKFYKHMGKRLGYKDFFKDVYVKMKDLLNKKESMTTTYENAMSELGSIDMLSDTAETVLKRISQQNSFDYKKLLDDMKVSKPNIQHPSQRVAIDNLTRKIEEETMGIIDGNVRVDAQTLVKSVQDIYNTDFGNATEILSDTVKLARDGDLNASNQLEGIVRQQYNDELSDLFAKHQDHILEQETLKNFEQRTYNFENAKDINAFADDLSDAVMNQLPDYAKTVNEVDRLIAIREVRMEEMDYFLKLNHVEKTEYLRLLSEDASMNNFIQGSLSREFDRAKQTRIQQMSTNRDGTGRRIEDYETEANLGITNKFDYNTIAEDAKEDISKLFFSKHITRTYNELPGALKARIDSLNEIASDVYSPTPRSTVSQRTLVSNDSESMSAFISSVVRGRLTSIDVEGLYKKIDGQLAEKGKGMDKRKKEYRELKKKAEDMKRAVDYKAHILINLKSKPSVLSNLSSKEVSEYIESFGLTSLERIDSVKSELFKLAERESRSGKVSKTGSIMRELNKRITESKQSLDDMFKLVDDPKMKEVIEDAILQQEELLLLKELFNFGVKLDDRSLLSIFGSALSNVKSKFYGSKKEISNLIKENAGFNYSIRNSDMDATKTIEGLQILIPHLVQGRYPGHLFSDLKPGQRFNLIDEGFGILKKEFGGEPPSDVAEMLRILGEKSLDETRTRNLTKSYNKFISSASENTYVTFLDDKGEAIIGRLSNADELPSEFANNVKLKVDVLSREVGNSRNTVEVPFSNVIKTDEDALRPIFNSYDATVEKQLIETRNKIEEFKNELAERIAREEEVLPELQDQINHITKEIDDLFAKRTGLTKEYHTKLGEMEALVQSIRSGIEAKKATGLDIEGTVKSLEVQYLAKKEASWIARFDEADPFTTAVPGTKEWEDLMEEIIERDEDLKALLPEYEKAQETLMKWADIEEMWKAQKQHYNTDEGYGVYLDSAFEEGVDEADLLSKTAYKANKKDLYTRDVNPEKVRQAKELAKQFEGLLKQKALGFQKGDGFILFREKTDLLAEWATVRDELQIKFDELETKKSELKQREVDFKRESRNSKARQKRKEANIEKLEAKDTAIEGEQFLLKARLEDEIAQLDKEVDKLQKRDAKLGREYDKYNKQINETIDTINEEVAILQREHALIAKEAQETTAERMSVINNTNTSIATLEAEMHKVNDEILRLEEALESNEALDAYLRMDLGGDLAEAIKRKSQGLPAYKFAIEDNANIRDNLKRFAVDFKREMVRMGREEISINKLGKKQFEAMINRYFPRVLSEDGERFFAEKRELLEHVRPLTSDYGFNTKFNNHMLGRVEELRELGIKEVNDFFEDHPEYGVRIFEENLARAYVGRAIKHAELMYDDEYTKIIMDLVGYKPVKKADGTFELKEGHEHVVNFGHLREYIRQMVAEKIKLAKRSEITDEMIGRFEKEVVDSLSLDPKLLDEYKMPMVKLEGEALEKLNSVGLVRQMNKQIIEEANSARMLQSQRDKSRMLQVYDKFTIWLKAMQTAVMPAFHIRNFQGNLFQNWLAVGAEAFNPKTIKRTFEVSRRIQDRDWLSQLDPIEFVDKNGVGQAIHWTKIVDEAIVHGVINEGFFAKDFDGYAKSSGLLGGGKWDFTSTDNFLPIKKGFEVGTIIENQGRLAQFTALLKQGYDFEEASEIVTKYLFDYSDLTHFEKKWMKRIFPYYTWMRKNSVLQVRELMNQPNKYAQVGKLGQSMENSADPNNEIEDKYISNYARDWTVMPFTMKNEFGVEEPVLFSSNLPFKDLAGMPFDPFNIVDSVRNLVAQTSPVFKKPAELLFNYNIHYDSPIVGEHAQNPITPRVNHVLTELAWYNAVSGFVKQDTAGDRFLSGLNTFGGIKMSSYDYEANKRRTIENAWEDYYGKFFGMSLNSAQMRITDAMTWNVKSALSSSIVKLAGLPPQAGEYSGALAPISEETYNSLSDEEKRKYTKPTNSEMGYINKRAQELSEQTYNESGVVKKFSWMMLDAIDVPYKNPIHAVRVNEVIDGDTLSISFGGGTENVRLLLVDTPESKGEYEDNPMAFGKEAYEFSKQMVLGKDVKLYLDGTDSYGRMLAFVEQDDSVLNEELLREGLGKVRYLYERGDKNYDVQRFREVENEAYQQGRGVWSIPGYATPGDTDFEGGRSSR